MSILKICIIYILRNRLQFTCVALMGFGDVPTSEESQLEELMKGRGNRVMGSIWRLCNVAFESGVVPEDWRRRMIGLIGKLCGKC